MVYKFFDRMSKRSDFKPAIKQHEQLAEELHKPIIRKFEKRKVYSSFKHNIWGTDPADMQLISKFNRGASLFYVSLIFLVNVLGLFF